MSLKICTVPIDLVVDKIERQIRKNKTRIRKEKIVLNLVQVNLFTDEAVEEAATYRKSCSLKNN